MSKKKDKEKKEKEAESVVASDNGAAPPAAEPKVSVSDKKISNKDYEEEMRKLQIELVKLQEWIKYKGLKVVVSSRAAMRPARAARSSASPRP